MLHDLVHYSARDCDGHGLVVVDVAVYVSGFQKEPEMTMDEATHMAREIVSDLCPHGLTGPWVRTYGPDQIEPPGSLTRTPRPGCWPGERIIPPDCLAAALGQAIWDGDEEPPETIGDLARMAYSWHAMEKNHDQRRRRCDND